MKNNIKTAGLLAVLGSLCVVIGSAIGGQRGLYFGTIFGLIAVASSYWMSDKLAIASARAQEVSEAQFPQYYATVRELCTRADLPMPRLYIAPNPQPNAFATGRNPKHAAVCINEGLIESLSWDEIAGVLAHELSHVKNRDILTSAVAAAIGTIISSLAQMAMWASVFSGGGGRDREGTNPLGALLMMVLGPIAAMFIQSAISRSREFEADASAARLLGTGEPLARALEKLEFGAQRIPVNINPNQASAYIVNPLSARQAMSKMFSTHPPMEERIARLRGGEWH